MGNAKRDDNYVPTLTGVDYTDLTTPELVGVDPANNRMLVSAIVTSAGSPVGFLPFEFDDIEWSGTPDALGNYPTATVRNNSSDVATLTFTYDVDGKLTRVQRT